MARRTRAEVRRAGWRSWWGVAVSLSLVGTGCRALPKQEAGKPAPVAEERAPLLPWASSGPRVGVPTQIVATWTDTVLQQSGVGAQRGFGGRLYFYDGGGVKPIPVAGQLVVYAFDETGRTPSDNRPTKRFVFPPDQFKLHRSASELGVSYSFWLPWDDAQGAAADISLIARFEPLEGGQLVVSDQATVRLPGRFEGPAVKPEKQIARRVQAVRQASHESPTNPDRPASTFDPAGPAGRTTGAGATVQTTTIPLPEGSRVHQAVTSQPATKPSRTTVTYQPRGRSAPPARR